MILSGAEKTGLAPVYSIEDALRSVESLRAEF